MHLLLRTFQLRYVGRYDANTVSLPARILQWEFCRQVGARPRTAIQYFLLDDGPAIAHDEFVFRRQRRSDVGWKEIGGGATQEIARAQRTRAAVCVGVPAFAIL